MIESLLSFKEVNKRPYVVMIWAFIISSIAVLISSQVAPSIPSVDPGFFVVLFVIIPSIYFMTALIKKEEAIEEEYIKQHYSKGFWERHEKDIMILLFYFGGLTLGFAVWSVFLPQGFFESQVAKINQIQGVTGYATIEASFMQILFNNLQVMIFSFLFSFIFGAGAVFIIAWNASILGVYIGQLSKYLWHIPVVSLAFLPHGIPEIAGYLCAGLAGGLLSAAIIRKNTAETLKIITLDSLKILGLGIFLILIGAGIEVLL